MGLLVGLIVKIKALDAVWLFRNIQSQQVRLKENGAGGMYDFYAYEVGRYDRQRKDLAFNGTSDVSRKDGF